MKRIAFLYLLKRDQMLIILYTVSFNASDVHYDLTFLKKNMLTWHILPVGIMKV